MKRDWQNAADSGDAGSLSAQLAAGADPNALDRYGQTALMRATLRGHAAAARVLVEAGANLDHTAKYGLSALMIAALNGRDEIVALLVEAGADRSLTGTGAPGFAGKTALDLAEHLGHETCAALLSEAQR